uniref:exodeoxyribonuclease III n=1 Tax=Kryptolebias marmoratus TaxID=37003 RepID=A0A3Q3ETQ5_KRYMA
MATSMTKLHVISWNVNGLNGQIKRAACLDFLRRHSVDIAFIQESHLRSIDTQRFANKFYYTAASASLSSKNRGSLIVLKRNLSLNILGKYGSEDGRVSYIKTIIAGHKFAFISIYAPSLYEPDFFSKLISVLTQIHDYSFIIGADMNACVNLTLDKSACLSTSTQIRSSNELQDFLSAFSLVDLYRVVNPTCKQYTFYSARHQSFSRLDYLLVSANSFSEIHKVVILPCPQILDATHVNRGPAVDLRTRWLNGIDLGEVSDSARQK